MGIRERLLEVRDAVGTNADLARIAGVSRSNVTQWIEGDVKSLKALTVINIQEKTGYSARWLVLGTGHKKNNGGKEVFERSDVQQKLAPKNAQKLLVVVQSFLDTDDEGRDQIVAAATSVRGENGATETSSRRAARR